MKLLLDTHVIIWWLARPEALSQSAMAATNDRSNTILVSAASAYEIEIKRPRDATLARIPETLHEAVLDAGFTWLAIEAGHGVAAAKLPLHHRDPWDRILVAQAAAEQARLVTCDRQLTAYQVTTLW
uniref:type II toxin-antitoxin system VapC family toxin n=1 Tax=uncultured Caulobacter sp. TaxID=158749 RepID=UPI0025D1E143|nr:type II toxin-antitoxin system VapC family toxin [uncultured Caulobacter sp.]